MAEREKGYWENKVKVLLKVELTKQGVTYAQLAEKMRKMGIPETEPNVRNKLSRGTFAATFLIQALEALGVSELRL